MLFIVTVPALGAFQHSKLLKPVVGLLKRGIYCIRLLDNMLRLDQSNKELVAIASQIVTLLQLLEIIKQPTKTNPDRVPGFDGGFSHNDLLYFHKETVRKISVMLKGEQGDSYYSLRTCKNDQQDGSNSSGGATSSSVLPEPSGIEECHIDHLRILQDHHFSQPKCQSN